MNTKIKELTDLVMADEKLVAKAKEIDAKHPEMNEEKIDAYIAFAKELGFELSKEEIMQTESRELSDDELDQVQGGFFITIPWWK